MDGEKSVKVAFELGEFLYNKGIDFDFMDYESVARAEVVKNELHVAGEKYKVLIIPSMKAIRFSTMQKAVAFFRSGGIVVNAGALPQASERIGSHDTELDAMITALFGKSAEDSIPSGTIKLSKNNGKALCTIDYKEIESVINDAFPRDFKFLSNSSEKIFPRVMHRKIGTRDLYAVYNVEKGTNCFFRTKGKVELWDPFTSKTFPLFQTKQTNDGTIIKMPLEQKQIQLIVFNPDENAVQIDSTNLDEILTIEEIGHNLNVSGNANSAGEKVAIIKTSTKNDTLKGIAAEPQPSIALDGEWEFEVKPILDNRWGDYHWPSTNEFIGPEIRRTKYADETEKSFGWEKTDFDDSGWPIVSNGFGPVFYQLGPLPDDVDINQISRKFSGLSKIASSDSLLIDNKYYHWQLYQISWRFGVENDPGHQGYHGLKEEMYDEFIRLGKKDATWTSTFYKKEDAGSNYLLFTTVFAPDAGKYQLQTGELKPRCILDK